MGSLFDYKETITYKNKIDIYLRCITVGFGGFMYGYSLSELTILNGELNIIFGIQQDQQLTYQTLMVGLMSAGACLISWGSDFMIRRLGRRKYMILSDIIFIVGACLGIIKNTYTFLVSRFIIGIAVGMNSNVVSMYIREVSPDGISGFTGSIFQIQINLGIIAGIVMSILCNFGNQIIQLNECSSYSSDKNAQEIKTFLQSICDGNGYWRIVVLFPTIFSIIRLATLLNKYKLDTPYYYYSIEKFDEGLQVLKEIYLDEYVDSESDNIIESLPKKIRASFTRYQKIQKSSEEYIKNNMISKQIEQKEDQSQNRADVTSNSNLNYESEDDCFNDQSHQYPLEGADLRSESQLNYNFMEDQSNNQESFTQKAQELKNKSLRRRMILGLTVNFLQQLTGINVVIQYTITVMTVSSGKQENTAFHSYFDKDNNILSYLTLLSYFYLLFAAAIGSTLNRQFGRKYFLFGGYLICCMLHIILGIMSIITNQSEDQSILKQIFTIVFVFVFYGTFNCSIGPVTWIYTSDILKGRYLSFSVAANWLGVLCASVMNIANRADYIYLNFFTFAAFCLIGCFVSQRYIIETEGKSYHEIIKAYSK